MAESNKPKIIKKSLMIKFYMILYISFDLLIWWNTPMMHVTITIYAQVQITIACIVHQYGFTNLPFGQSEL